MYDVIEQSAIDRRLYWIDEIVKLSGDFGADAARIEEELAGELKTDGVAALLDHLRLCSAIPESYGHDSSEEKLYSKYTDALISVAYNQIGLNSRVLAERADAADVEAVTTDYSFVADAKVFRLSRTAKNQKDFKVQAMDGWKRGKPFAMVVCPLYQLPSRTSQIYQQAGARDVCIFSYAHLSVLARLADACGQAVAIDLLKQIFQTVSAMNPSKDATTYWQSVNKTVLAFGEIAREIWKIEKIATLESIEISKELALQVYANEREAIMRLSHEAALQKLIEMHKIESRINTIQRVADNALMGLG